MSESAKPPTARTEPDASWALLARHVEEFVAAWDDADEPPRLDCHVPVEPDGLRRLVLVELVKIDLEYRWQRSLAPLRLEDYIRMFPELAEPELPCDLVYEEYHIRKQAGEQVQVTEYLERFASQATEVGRLLGAAAHQTTTVLVQRRQVDALEAGTQVDDFDLLVLLGKGAFASVFLARQRSMQRLVALKVSSNRGDEPQTLAQLDHPNIVRVHDQRLLPERGLRLLYMQYVPGGTLHQVVEKVRNAEPHQRNGKLLLQVIDEALARCGEEPPAESTLRDRLGRMHWPGVVCWLGARLAAALDHAHRKSVLHRDVKPANVLLTMEGQPKLADFNISFSSKLDGSSPAAYFGGSLAYMPLEQLEACSPRYDRDPESLDGRADVFALAVVLWELLTGSRPFPDVSLAGGWNAALERMIEQRRAGVSRTLPPGWPTEAPAGLDRLLLDCLSPNVDDRPGSAAELARRLELCLKPEAQRLIHPAPSSWRTAARRFPVLFVLAAAIVPNALLAVFNHYYNEREIVQELIASGIPTAQSAFQALVLAINGIAFAIGIGIVAWLAWPIAQALRTQPSDGTGELHRILWLRQRCLRIGHMVGLLGICEWLLAGIAYPAAMHLAIGAMGERGWEVYLHFLASLVLCGLIAAALPFFAITRVSASAWYPALARSIELGERDRQDLDQLRRLTWLYLLVAACVPMFALTLLVLIGTGNRLALLLLGLGGLAGFALAFWLARLIQGDLDALASLAEGGTGAGDSFTSR